MLNIELDIYNKKLGFECNLKVNTDTLNYIRFYNNNGKLTNNKFISEFFFELENIKETLKYCIDDDLEGECHINDDTVDSELITVLQNVATYISEYLNCQNIVSKLYYSKNINYNKGVIHSKTWLPVSQDNLFNDIVKFKAFPDFKESNLKLSKEALDSQVSNTIIDYYLEKKPFLAFSEKSFIDNLFDLKVFIDNKSVKNKMLNLFIIDTENYYIEMSNVTEDLIEHFMLEYSKQILKT